jgi:hypothetical protein
VACKHSDTQGAPLRTFTALAAAKIRGEGDKRYLDTSAILPDQGVSA